MTYTIPASPYSFKLDIDHAALLIIDMQRDFIEPGGFGESLGNAVAPLQKIVPVVARLLAGFRNTHSLVVHTRECHKADLSDCPPAKRNRGQVSLKIGDQGPMGRILVSGEPGADIVPELTPLHGEIVIDKSGKGAFYATGLHDILQQKGIKQLVLAGVTTEVCVQTTMREANDRGYECILAEDATESYFPEFKASVLAMIVAQGGIVGWTTTTDAILEAVDG